MIQAALLVLLVGPAGSQGTSSQLDALWLVVAASDPSPAGIARKAQRLSSDHQAGLVFQTRDCGDRANVFGFAAEIATTAEAAHEALARVRTTLKEAYVKRCQVRPRTLLALRVPAVDLSIADVPENAVNWSDDDRVSAVLPVSKQSVLLIVRHFAISPDDPREGRRERIVWIGASNQPVTLADDCMSPGGATERRGRLALHCGGELAADELLHSVLVFDATGKRIAEIKRCRSPRWVADDAISCSEESVGPDGGLKLRARRVSVELPPAAK
jgi:hypothetical protein